jgi:hypothetical protein
MRVDLMKKELDKLLETFKYDLIEIIKNYDS